MKTRVVQFTGRREARVIERTLPPPAAGEVTVRVTCSAISAGTEMLFYRGAIPEGQATDTTLAALSGPVSYPLVYGYAAAGVVERLGAGVDTGWMGRRVFAFQPHTARFITPVEALIPLPDEVSDEEAVFLPNMETALSLAHDAGPIPGERVAVFGAGVVGLLTVSVLAGTRLRELLVLDPLPYRREQALSCGATHAGWPADGGDFDLCIDVSGRPAGLEGALALAGPSGRIVVGSWYHEPVGLNLGARYHRARQTILSSQVSTIAPMLRGRWDKPRRLDTARWLIAQLRPSRLVTHRFPLEAAPEAYALVDAGRDGVLQVLFTYET